MTVPPYDPHAAAILITWARSVGIAPDLAITISQGEAPGLDVWAIGDGGQSFGALQIHIPAHGGPPERWTGYDGLRASLAQMESRWLRTLQGIPDAGEQWRDDPVAFLRRAWPRMQGADADIVARRAPEVAPQGLAIYADWVARSEGCPRDPATGLLMPCAGSVGRRFGVVDQWAPAGHRGIDFPVAEGADVRAVRGGVVRYSGPYDYHGQPILRSYPDPIAGLGLLVVVEDDRGVRWRYGHNAALLVYTGQRVLQGETIARAGSTGYSTGPHVHLERLVNGEPTDPAIDLLEGEPEPPLPPDPEPPDPEPERDPRELVDALTVYRDQMRADAAALLVRAEDIDRLLLRWR